MKEYSITINLTENDLRDLQAKESFDWCFPAIKNDDGKKVYDLEAMAEEFENELSKLTRVTIMCSISDDIVWEK